jgi:hypothetical protein
MRNTLLSLILAIASISCSINSKSTEYIDLESIMNSTESVGLSQIAEEVKYIPLESSNEALLGNVQKIMIAENTIIVSDIYGSGSRLLLFDLNGKFIKQVGSMGNGPGEYGQISDFYLAKNNTEIQVVTNNKKNILRFSLIGDFIGNGIEVNDDVTVIYTNGNYYSHFPSNMLFFNKDKKHQLTIRNGSGDILSRQYPVNPLKNTYMNPFIEFVSFSKTKQGCYYHVPNDNVLYEITDTVIIAAKEFNFGKYNVPTDYKWDFAGVQKAKTLDFASVQKIQIAGNIIFVNYSREGKKGLILHTKNKSINVGEGSNIGIKDDINGCGFITDFNVQDSILFDYIAPYAQADCLEGDNYVIRIVKLKKI